MKKGLFVTFEGGEGAGKTSLIDRLYLALQERGLKVVKTLEPGGSKFGEHMRHWLLHREGITIGPMAELMLFLADRAQHLEECIVPALQAGQIVLCDRFNDSSVAYQGAGRGLGIEKVEQLCKFACKDVEPDLTLYLDCDPEVGLKRLRQKGAASADRIESENLPFHRQIREAFRTIAARHPARIKMLDATLPQEEVFRLALESLSRLC